MSEQQRGSGAPGDGPNEKPPKRGRTESPGGSRPRKKGKRRAPGHDEGARLRKGPLWQPGSYDEVRRAFLACPRCSYFFMGYRALNGEPHLQSMVDEAVDGRLSLVWDAETRELAHKIYGQRIDLEVTHFHAVCEACRRTYGLQMREDESAPAVFVIDVMPP